MKTVITLFLAFVLGTPFVFAQDYIKDGDACYNKMDYACALGHYQKAVETNMNMNKGLVFFRIGYSLNRVNKPEEAKKWLLQALHAGEQQADWSLAESHFNTRKYDSAAIYFEKTFYRATDKNTKLSTSYAAANSYSMQGLYRDALKWVQEALTIEPADLPSLRLKGSIEMDQADAPSAEKTYRAAIAVSTEASMLKLNYYQLARALFEQKKYTEAIPVYRAILFYDPTYVNSFAGMGDCYRYLNRIDSAGFYYDKAIATQIALKGKKDSAAIVRIANAAARMYMREFKDTVATLTKYLPNLIAYERVPSIVPVFMNMAVATKNLKLIETALPLYITTLKQRNQIKDATSWEVKLADVYAKAKQGAKVTALYRSAMMADPTMKPYLKGYVDGLIQENKLKIAIDTLRKRSSLINATDKSDLMLLEAHILYLMNDTATAAKVCKEVLKLSYIGRASDFAYNANYLMGKMAIERKDTIAAHKFWDQIRLQSLNRNAPMYNEYEMHNLLGLTYYSRAGNYTGTQAISNYKVAADHFKKALSFDSSKAITHLFYGSSLLSSNNLNAGRNVMEALIPKSYSKNKDTAALINFMLASAEIKATTPNYQSALAYLNKGLSHVPSDSNLLTQKASIHYTLKDYNEAITTFGKLINIYKTPQKLSISYYNRALCHYMNKSKALAMADVEKSLTLQPDYPDAKKLKTMIEELTE